MSRVKVGDTINAIVREGPESKNVIGEEMAGKVAWFCPEKVLKVTPWLVETKTSRYPFKQFSFVVVK